MKFHHLGVASTNIRETLEQVKSLFQVSECTDIIHDSEQDADLCMVYVTDGVTMELIAGPIVRNIARKGVMLYHTCWEVVDLERAIATMSENGCRLIAEPKQAVLFGNRRVAFLSTRLGIVELLEASP